MTKEDIVNWAHKAGFLIDTHAQQYQPNCILSTYGLIDENLQRFANLAAAAEREAIEKLADASILDEYGLDAIAFVAEWKAAQRPWVGLTDEDWEHIDNKKGTALDTFAQGAVWAADQLKEKNSA